MTALFMYIPHIHTCALSHTPPYLPQPPSPAPPPARPAARAPSSRAASAWPCPWPCCCPTLPLPPPPPTCCCPCRPGSTCCGFVVSVRGSRVTRRGSHVMLCISTAHTSTTPAGGRGGGPRTARTAGRAAARRPTAGPPWPPPAFSPPRAGRAPVFVFVGGACTVNQ